MSEDQSRVKGTDTFRLSKVRGRRPERVSPLGRLVFLQQARVLQLVIARVL